MRISATVIIILISTYIVGASVLDPVIENVVHLQASKPPKGVGGMWKKKTIWKPRWIKEWKSAKVMKPVWKKIWSPVQIREWVPIPKPPPGWDSVSTPLSLIHPKPKTLLQDSAGYGSFPVQAASNIPLWDPVPYPESQQPPPPPPPPPSVYPDNTHSATFNEEQISGIIGARYNTHEYSSEYSETVNHLTRLPVANNWRPPQPLPNFHNFPALPEFLIPPQYQTLLENNPRLQEQNSPVVEVQKSFGKWIPLPPENKPKVPDAPYRLRLPETLIKNSTNKFTPPADVTLMKEKPNFRTHNVSDILRHHADGDFIQEAQLVGEFHYSEFDLTKKLEQMKEDKNKVNQKNEGIIPNKEADNKPKQIRTEIKSEKTTLKPIPKEIYPVYENPNLFFIPPNHRFAPLDKNNPKDTSNETSTKVYTTAATQSAPEGLLYKNDDLQIVYPTAPQTAPDTLYKTYNHNTSAEDLQTTTEKPSTPFSIVFPSSLGEEVTKSPVFIVTPAKTDNS